MPGVWVCEVVVNQLTWFSGVLFESTLNVLAAVVVQWWDDFLEVWGMFHPERRKAYLASLRETQDADQMACGGGGSFDGAGTGGQD